MHISRLNCRNLFQKSLSLCLGRSSPSTLFVMSVVLILMGGISILVAILLHLAAQNERPKEFPPGPNPLPILGNLHQIGLEPHKSFVKLGKKYGRIFSVDFGFFRSVVINDLKLLKQCLNDPAFSGRPKFQILLDRTGPGAKYIRGIGGEGRHWMEQRQFALKNLRHFGFGKTSMEGIIQEQISEFMEGLLPLVGKPIDTALLFNAAVLNSLWRICTRTHMMQNDERLQKLLAGLADLVSALTPLALFYPILIKAFPGLTGYTKVTAAERDLEKFIKEEYDRHKATLIPGEPRDLLDTMIEEIAATTDPNSSFYKEEGEASVIATLKDLFGAGSESTSTTLTWLLLCMALFPEIQEKLSEEIQSVVGPSRYPELVDRQKMPYTECVIMEVMRSNAVFPLSVIRSAIEDVTVAGYYIPKDTVLTPNLYAVFHDAEIWGDPENFRPERFFLPNGTGKKSHEAFLPFGYGKRVCPGEKLAKDSLFLFFTRIFQHFRVTTNPKGPKPSLKARRSFILSPAPHELILHDRF